MPTKERNASPSIPREVFIVADTEITVDPSGKAFPFFMSSKGQLSHSLTVKGIVLV